MLKTCMNCNLKKKKGKYILTLFLIITLNSNDDFVMKMVPNMLVANSWNLFFEFLKDNLAQQPIYPAHQQRNFAGILSCIHWYYVVKVDAPPTMLAHLFKTKRYRVFFWELFISFFNECSATKGSMYYENFWFSLSSQYQRNQLVSFKSILFKQFHRKKNCLLKKKLNVTLIWRNAGLS